MLIRAEKLDVTKSGLKGSGVSDVDIDGRRGHEESGDTICEGSKRRTNRAGVEFSQARTSGDGGYDAVRRERG